MTPAEIRKHYRSLDLVIIGYTLFAEGGDWRSIYLYYRDAQQRGQRVKLIDGKRSDGTKQLLAAGFLAPRILVNGLNSLLSWPCLCLCLLRKDVYVYLHGTQYIFEEVNRRFPLRARLIAVILRRNPLLCVSQQAEKLYRERFGSTRTQVVYECIRVGSFEAFKPGFIQVLMAGTMDQRKGVSLFSKAADLAESQFPDWQFHWCGGSSADSQLYRSNRVVWHGWQPVLQPFLERSQILFLSSSDDPCPLVALEALACGKKCVVYRRTGIAELIEGIPGCAVYEDYTPEAALAALAKAAGVPLDQERVRDTVLGRIAHGDFAANLETALGVKPLRPSQSASAPGLESRAGKRMDCL